MQPGNMAYDRAITVFSPDGRLFQVEYAREAVKRGTTTVGLKFKDGVVLIIDKRITSRLIEPQSIEKIFKIDEHVGCATSGLVADARVLVDRARVEAQINKITYAERTPIEILVNVSAISSRTIPNMAEYDLLARPCSSPVWTARDRISSRPTQAARSWHTRPAALALEGTRSWRYSRRSTKRT